MKKVSLFCSIIFLIAIVTSKAQSGSLDYSFGDQGIFIGDIGSSLDQASHTAVYPDGKILMLGHAHTGDRTVPVLTRHHADGTLDESFADQGKFFLYLDYHAPSYGIGVSLLPDGKILVGGGPKFYVARLESDGTLDQSFGEDGVVAPFYWFPYNKAMVVQTDGKIVVFYESGFAEGIVPIRLNTDGSNDDSFEGEKLLTGEDRYTHDAVIQPDGKIVITGRTYSQPEGYRVLVARYNTDGSLDDSFAVNGVAVADLSGHNDEGNALTMQPDGKILVAGKTVGPTGYQDVALGRFNPDGSPDLTFGSEGWVITNTWAAHDVGYGVAVQSNGDILVAGTSVSNYERHFLVMGFHPDGTTNTSFSANGTLVFAIDELQSHGRTVSLLADGKIILGGDSNDQFALAKVLPDGSFDEDFGTSGTIIIPSILGANDVATSLLVQPDGKVIAAGFSLGQNQEDFSLLRINADGTLDDTFGDDGVVITSRETRDFAYAAALQSDGKIILAGTFSGEFGLARYHADGTLDLPFGGHLHWPRNYSGESIQQRSSRNCHSTGRKDNSSRRSQSWAPAKWVSYRPLSPEW